MTPPSEHSFRVRMKAVLQALALTYSELASILGVDSSEVCAWARASDTELPALIDDVLTARMTALANLAIEWTARAGEQGIPRWCWGSPAVADGCLLERLSEAVQEGRSVAPLLDDVARRTRITRDPTVEALLATIPLPLSDQEMMMRFQAHGQV